MNRHGRRGGVVERDARRPTALITGASVEARRHSSRKEARHAETQNAS